MAIETYTAEEIISTPPEVVLTDLPLVGEPATDRGFVTENGTKIRARIIQIGSHETRAPTSGDVVVAPSGRILSLTLAKLNDDHSVATDSTGAFLIMDRHELILSDEAMKNPTFDVGAAVEAIVRQQAHLLEQRVANRASVTDYLAQHWGGAVLPPPPEPEPTTDPAEPVAAAA
ncbi:MAG TPA: hypothetical protein VHL34_25140 [Rhizomicrobium sp.]|jgi:hypothetical protein|nr:hypothetical protein [Rhizomicrobium sp.]